MALASKLFFLLFLPSNHPYLKYLIMRRDAKKSRKNDFSLPKSDDYVPCWQQSVIADYEDIQNWAEFEKLNLSNDPRCIDGSKSVISASTSTTNNVNEVAIFNEDEKLGTNNRRTDNMSTGNVSSDSDFIAEEEMQMHASERARADSDSIVMEDTDKSSVYAVAKQLYRVLEIKDRTYHLKTYPSCFWEAIVLLFYLP